MSSHTGLTARQPSSTVTINPARGVRGIGMISLIVGILMIVAGVGVWTVVSMTLSDEEITVSEDSTFLGGTFAGDHVAGPFTAYAQADAIDMHATEMADGQTYAELEQDDPVRESVMDASFLRASLFTSVVAFGVCALVIGLGIMFILLGGALRRLAGGPQVAVETPGLTSQGDLSAARHADGPPTSPMTPAPAPGPPAPPSRSTTRATSDAPTTVMPPGAPPSAPPPPSSRPGATGTPGTSTTGPSDPGEGPRA